MAVVTAPLQRPRFIDLSMYLNIYQMKEFDKNKDTYVMECPIHGKFTIPASYNTAEQVFMMCPKCVTFCDHIITLYGKGPTFDVMRVIYQFAWDNKIIIDRIKKAIANDEDRCHMVYKIIREKVKTYKEPKLLSDMISELDNIDSNELNIRDLIKDSEVSSNIPTLADEFLAKINKHTFGTIEFVNLEESATSVSKELVAICPIHGTNYTTSLADIHSSKIKCEECLPYYGELTSKYNPKTAFGLIISIYDDFNKYKRNRKHTLSFKSIKMLNVVKPDYEQAITFEENQLRQSKELPVDSPVQPKAVNTIPDDVVHDNTQSEKVSSKKSRAVELVGFLNTITAADIKSIRIEADLETERELITVVLKSGKEIIITT